MTKLAVFFPGIGYTVDKPLMYYSRKIASANQYEIKLLPYSGFPTKVIGDEQKMEKSYEIALNQAKEMLSDVDWSIYDEVLFIGKSIGTIVATALADQYGIRDKVRFILYTPLEQTFLYPIREAIVFSGTKDPWVGNENSKINRLCREHNIGCELIADANHSLETGNAIIDIENMQQIMTKTENFIEKG